MEFYAKQAFNFDEDTTDTEDDSGIAEISSVPLDYNKITQHDEEEDQVILDVDTIDNMSPGQEQHQQQPQDPLGRFFSYW